MFILDTLCKALQILPSNEYCHAKTLTFKLYRAEISKIFDNVETLTFGSLGLLISQQAFSSKKI